MARIAVYLAKHHFLLELFTDVPDEVLAWNLPSKYVQSPLGYLREDWVCGHRADS